MRRFALLALFSSSLLLASHDPEVNVNERYIIEKVEVSGFDTRKLSSGLQDEMEHLSGQRFNQDKINGLAKRLRRELPGRQVWQKLARGNEADRIKVVFHVSHWRPNNVDLTVRGLYHARQGWTGGFEVPVRVAQNVFAFGLVSDGDTNVERFTGLRARYENLRLGTDVLGLGFRFESYHITWNGATRQAVDQQSAVPGIYRTRQNFQPELRVKLTRDLQFTTGVSFERFQTQFPAAHTQTANAVVNTLRYDRELEGSGDFKQRLEAGYTLRAATRIFSSDFVYGRHEFQARYTLGHGRHQLVDEVRGGLLTGQAPLFERFVLGNAETLRGWNKYDIAPLGADRFVHNSLRYSYRCFQTFYDAGSLWNRGASPVARHSLGVGLQVEGVTFLLGFPVRSGRAEPIFMVALNFK